MPNQNSRRDSMTDKNYGIFICKKIIQVSENRLFF
jgi:hypothetical protein